MTARFRILAPLGILALAAGFLLFKQHQAGPEPSPGEAPLSAAAPPSAPQPKGASPAASVPALLPGAEDQAKASVLDSVLAAHNDNDPRLDRELRELSEPAKQLFREKYASLPEEKRNELGTIVFLLGRNIRKNTDLDFLEKVINSSCRSLQNCNSDLPPAERSSLHSEAGMELTLAYPQVMALKGLERVLQEGRDNPLYQRSLDLLNAASHSPNPKIAQVAQGILAKASRP